MIISVCRALFCVTIGCGLVISGGAQPPADQSERLRRALVGPDAAYLPLAPELVCGPRVLQVVRSPRATDALIVRRAEGPPRDLAALMTSDRDDEVPWRWLESGQGETQILLWGSGSRRAATVWRRAASLQNGYADVKAVWWFDGSQTALAEVQIVHGPLTPELLKRVYDDGGPPVSKTFLRINARNGSVETLADGLPQDAHLVYRGGKDIAALATNDGKSLTLIEPNQPLGTPLAVPLDATRKERAVWGSWRRDGRKVDGLIVGRDENDKYFQRNVTFDVSDGTLTKREPDPLPRGVPPAPPLVPYRLQAKPATLTHRSETISATALWIEGGDPKATPGQVLLSANADRLPVPVELTTSVLYGQQDSLWATPLLKVPLGEFLAARREQYKRDALRRARRIGVAVTDLLDEEKQLPPREQAAERLAAVLLGDPNVVRNPATGKPGFTPAYTSLHPGDYPSPRTAVFGYLNTEGGRVAIYLDGHVAWENTRAKP